MSSSEEFASADEEEGAGAHGPRAGRGGHGGGGSPDVKQADGWDDFDIDDEPEPEQPNREDTLVKRSVKPTKEAGTNEIEKDSDDVGDGWGKFDDWVQDNPTKQASEDPKKTLARSSEDEKIKSVADRLADISTKETPAQASSGWGWGGWGVDSLLSTATAGISSITSHVSQGISSVSNALETGIGAPDPEELAKRNIEAKEEKPDSPGIKPASQEEELTTNYDDNIKKSASNEGAFALGSLMSGVSHITKFVESTGTKVIAGSLDTLETIGKKTMEVLQDGDPGLAKKRAMLGLDSGDKPVLSQVLREAKTKADEEDSIREQKREAKEVHYETLFDDFEGLVHLEALEMLSRQTSMRLEDRLRSVQADKRQEMKETLQQVAELCEMPDSDEEVDDVTTDHELTRPEILYNRLREATQDLGLSLQFQPLVRQFTDTLDWLSNSAEVAELEKSPEKCVYKKGVSTLAQCTALCVEVYHKTAEMLLVKQRRSTADEADALTQMTSVLTRHISELATVLTDKLNALSTVDSKEQVNTYITNIFLEAGNSSTYIQNAFQLTLPILQIGAA